jgi:hypothetical protein
MPFPLLAAGAALGGLGSLIGGITAGKAQKNAANSQKNIANEQLGLYQQASPLYANLLAQLHQHAYQAQNPHNDPAQMALFNQVNEQIGHQYHNAQDQLSFGLGRRGLAGSSMDVAGRAALLANANQQRGAFERQQVINQPMEFERRLGLLGNALNPGLGMGQIAGSTFGQQAGMYGQQAGAAGANLGQSIQNFMLYNALHSANKAAPYGGETLPSQGGIPGVYTPPFAGEGGNLGALAQLLQATQPGLNRQF